MKKLFSLLMLSALAISLFTACSLHAEQAEQENETPQQTEEAVKISSDALINSNILDSCKKIRVYNYAEVDISDKETISQICGAVKNAQLEEAPARELPKGVIKTEILAGSVNKTLYLSDDLIFIDDKVYRDGSKSIIGEVKAHSDKYIMDSCILDSCDKIVINGFSNTAVITKKSEIAEICDAVMNADFKMVDVGYPVGKDGGLYVEFFGGGRSQSFQPDEVIFVNNVGFRLVNSELCDIITKYYDMYGEKQ